MTAPWIQIYSNLVTHRKTGALADALGLSYSAVAPNVIAAGMLVSLWSWAIQNAYDGDLSRCSARCIADACGWRKSGKSEALIAALKESGYLDNNMHLHDWEEYTVLYLDSEEARREKTRIRVAEHRQRKKERYGNTENLQNKEECNADVSVTGVTSERYGNAAVSGSNAPTIPNHTIPVPNKTVQSIDTDDIYNKNNNNYIYHQEERKEKKKEVPSRAEFYLDKIKLAREALTTPGAADRVIARVLADALSVGLRIDPNTFEVKEVEQNE